MEQLLYHKTMFVNVKKSIVLLKILCWNTCIFSFRLTGIITWHISGSFLSLPFTVGKLH